jgi:nicotinamidase-related amidase
MDVSAGAARPSFDAGPRTPRGEALLVIDLQRDYFADGELERCRADLVSAVNVLVRSAREAGVLVVEVRTEHDPGRSTWTLSMLEDDSGVVLAGTEGAEPPADLETGDATTITKTRDSAFFDTSLRELLTRHGVAHVTITGISTESCVAATARDAFAHDLTVTLVEEATASIDPRLHEQTLRQLAHQYRQEVASSRAVLRRWATRRGAEDA